jgi:phosphate transport system permease protein
MFRFRSISIRWMATGSAGGMIVASTAALCLFLVFVSMKAISEITLVELASGTWAPAQGHFGILPVVAGTLATCLIALLLAVPAGMSAALYLTYNASLRTRRFYETAIGMLASVPSIILGLWGLTWIVPVFGHSLTSASIVLAIMVAPTFTLLACGALRQLSGEYIETLRALPVSDWAAAWMLIRAARHGILCAGPLAISRGIGEAVALSMVAGNVPGWPELSRPVSTLATTLIVEFDGSSGLHRSAIYLLALIVMALITLVSMLQPNAATVTPKAKQTDD